MAVELGRADPTLPARISSALEAWDLTTTCPPYHVEDIVAATAHDKKRKGRVQRWVLPTGVGEVEIVEDVPPHVIETALSDLGARSSQ
jgi:3-dehydroquinate synthetase